MLTDNGKIKIFFADPDHNSEFTNTSNESRLRPVPFGISRIAAYSKKKFPQIEFKLFKNIKKMLEDLKNDEPNILAISHYFWNTKLSHRIARFAKELYPNILIVMGGPNLDRNHESYEEYSKNYPFVDFVVIGEAEFVMKRIIKSFINNNFDIKKCKDIGVSGAFSIIDKGKINYINDNHRTR